MKEILQSAIFAPFGRATDLPPKDIRKIFVFSPGTVQGLGFQLVSITGIMSKNKEFMQLLGLKPGDYELDGCVVGMPKIVPEPRKERRLEDFVTWVQ